MPSLTELLCELGLAEQLVGRTGATVPVAQISPVDGEVTSRHGSRAITSLRYLAAFGRRLPDEWSQDK